MAVYVPDAERRRRSRRKLAAVGLVAILVGFVLGELVGASRATTAAEQLHTAQGRAAQAIDALTRLPLEYDQALAGTQGESMDTMAGAVDDAAGLLHQAYESAPWIGQATITKLDGDVRAVADAARARVSPDAFAERVATGAAAIAEAFNTTVRATD